jgi:hypothetical protein
VDLKGAVGGQHKPVDDSLAVVSPFLIKGKPHRLLQAQHTAFSERMMAPVIVFDEAPPHQTVIVACAPVLGDLDLPVPFLSPQLLVMIQKLLQRHDPEGALGVEPLHRFVEARPQKGLDPFFIALDSVDINEPVLKRAFLELAYLRN